MVRRCEWHHERKAEKCHHKARSRGTSMLPLLFSTHPWLQTMLSLTAGTNHNGEQLRALFKLSNQTKTPVTVSRAKHSSDQGFCVQPHHYCAPSLSIDFRLVGGEDEWRRTLEKSQNKVAGEGKKKFHAVLRHQIGERAGVGGQGGEPCFCEHHNTSVLRDWKQRASLGSNFPRSSDDWC